MKVSAPSVVTAAAATGDGGNNWGGFEPRLVDTGDGLFTAYSVPTARGDLHRQWRLAWKTGGSWRVIASGPGGREPPSLLAPATGRLFVIAWPGGRPQLTTVTHAGAAWRSRSARVPGRWLRNDYPYATAALTKRGSLVVLQSNQLTSSGAGDLRVGTRDPASGRWRVSVTPTQFRYAYAWLVPTEADALVGIATRDVPWKGLRYRRPRGAFGYVYNQVRLFETANVTARPLRPGSVIREERPSRRFPNVNASAAQPDVYRDTSGRIHVLYSLQGPTTRGALQLRHAVVADGRVVADAPLPPGLTDAKLVEDRSGRFFLVATQAPSQLLVYPGASSDGTRLGKPWRHSLKYPVHYAGITIAQNGSGRAASDRLEVVYPSGAASRPAIAALEPSSQARQNLWVQLTLELP